MFKSVILIAVLFAVIGSYFIIEKIFELNWQFDFKSLIILGFSESRIELENVHILFGIAIFYIVLLRLIWKLINPSIQSEHNFFKGQNIIAKTNHFLLYVSIFAITARICKITNVISK